MTYDALDGVAVGAVDVDGLAAVSVVVVDRARDCYASLASADNLS